MLKGKTTASKKIIGTSLLPSNIKCTLRPYLRTTKNIKIGQPVSVEFVDTQDICIHVQKVMDVLFMASNSK